MAFRQSIRKLLNWPNGYYWGEAKFSSLCTDLHQVGDGRQHHRHPGAQQGDQGRGKPAGDAVDAIDETIPKFVGGKIVTF